MLCTQPLSSVKGNVWKVGVQGGSEGVYPDVTHKSWNKWDCDLPVISVLCKKF